MTPTNNSPVDGENAARSVGDKITDAASSVKQMASDMGRNTAETMEETRRATANGLDRTASALHQGGDKFTGLAHSTADKLAGTAEYLRNHDMKSMMTDVEKAMKNNPGVTLLAAGILGFLLGSTLRRSDAS